MSKTNSKLYAPLADIKTEKDLDTLIESGLISIQKSKDLLQLVGVAILSHFAIHGNWLGEKVNAFITDKRLNGTNQTLIAAWFMQYGGYKRTVGEIGFTGHNGAEHVKVNFQDAKDNLWYTPAKSGADAFKALDLNTDIAKLIKRYETAKKRAATAQEAGTEVQEIDLSLSEAMFQQLLNLGEFDSMLIHSDRVTVEAVETTGDAANDTVAAAEQATG